MTAKPYLILIPLTALVAYIFHHFPMLDIQVSSLFYDDETKQFPFHQHWFFYGVEKGVYWLEYICLALPLISLLQIQFKKKPLLPLSRVRLAFLIVALIAGPGVIVHQGFKEYFGRARPTETTAFGGVHDFTLPFIVSDADSASFVSGHAAMGYYLAAYAFVVSRKKRNVVYAGGIAAGLFTGFCRVVQGRHFLSDIVFSGFVMLIFFHFLSWLMLRREQPHHHDSKNAASLSVESQ